MPWFNVDDGFAFHRKAVMAGNSAIGLWVRAGSWCARELTDGFVPDHMVRTMGTAAQAARLVACGLWHRDDIQGGYQFHEYTDDGRNLTREQVLAQRAYDRRKSALQRDKDLVAAVRARDGDRCRYCGCLVNWGDRRGSSGATYDHVDPDGPNTIGNVVVACRGCNSRKGGRTPESSGMRLLDPKSMGVSEGSAGHRAENQERTSSEPDPNQNGSSPNQGPLHSPPLPIEKKKTSSSSRRLLPPREDVEQLCVLLADRVEANKLKRPEITDTWRTEARLMLDRDERDPLQAARLIEWATNDEFWSGNILSMPKFRKQYDQLLMKARREHQARQSATREQPRPSTTDRAVAQAELLKSNPNPAVLAQGGFGPLSGPELRMLPGGVA